MRTHGLWKGICISVAVLLTAVYAEEPDPGNGAKRDMVSPTVAVQLSSTSSEELGEPHFIGEIAAIENEGYGRILILEPEEATPTYWFSFNPVSKAYDNAGNDLLFTDLQVGEKVLVWSTGMIEESMPALGVIQRLELAAESQNPM
jgi:hypothetical protein